MQNKILSEEIKQIIRNDIPLREKIAIQLGISQRTVYLYACESKREKALTRYPIVLITIKKHTGLADNKILI
jgi:hypothetical protein